MLGKKIRVVKEVHCEATTIQLRVAIDIIKPFWQTITTVSADYSEVILHLKYENFLKFCFCCDVFSHVEKDYLQSNECVFGSWLHRKPLPHNYGIVHKSWWVSWQRTTNGVIRRVICNWSYLLDRWLSKLWRIWRWWFLDRQLWNQNKSQREVLQSLTFLLFRSLYYCVNYDTQTWDLALIGVRPKLGKSYPAEVWPKLGPQTQAMTKTSNHYQRSSRQEDIDQDMWPKYGRKAILQTKRC